MADTATKDTGGKRRKVDDEAPMAGAGAGVTPEAGAGAGAGTGVGEPLAGMPALERESMYARHRRTMREQAEARQTTVGRQAAAAAAAASDLDTRPRAHFGSFVERYFTQMFCVDGMGEARHDQYVNMHSNRLVVVGLAPTHPAIESGLAGGATIASVSFKTAQGDLSAQVVSGKRKKGGAPFGPGTPIATITMSDGTAYTAYACCRAKLLQVNHRLLEEPELLATHASEDGWLAILNPKLQNVLDIQKGLLTLDAYRALRSGTRPKVGAERGGAGGDAAGSAGGAGGAGSAAGSEVPTTAGEAAPGTA